MTRARPRLRRLALVVALALPAPARAQPPMRDEAKAHLDRGYEAYQAQEYARAIEEFRRGWEIDPRIEFLFGWAQAARLQGDCEQAVELYRRILDSRPSESQVDVVQGLMAECAEILAARTDTPATPEPAADPTPEPTPASAPAERRPWSRDPAGGILVGLGAGAVGAGIGMLAVAQVRAAALGRADTYADYDRVHARTQDSVPVLRAVGGVAVGVGAGLLVGGIVRWAVLARAERRGGPVASVGPQGATLGWAGRF